MAGAYAKIENHEELCALRYQQIFDTLGELKGNAEGQSKLLWGVMVGIASFTLVTLLAIVLHALKLT